MNEPSSNPLAEIVKRFKGEASETAKSIDDMARSLAGAADPRASVSAIREQAHKLKGAAGVLDFPDVKNRAAAVEEIAASIAIDSAMSVEAIELAGKALESAADALLSAVDAGL